MTSNQKQMFGFAAWMVFAVFLSFQSLNVFFNGWRAFPGVPVSSVDRQEMRSVAEACMAGDKEFYRCVRECRIHEISMMDPIDRKKEKICLQRLLEIRGDDNARR